MENGQQLVPRIYGQGATPVYDESVNGGNGSSLDGAFRGWIGAVRGGALIELYAYPLMLNGIQPLPRENQRARLLSSWRATPSYLGNKWSSTKCPCWSARKE